MRLSDCYRLLDVDPRASLEEVKRAHRDLTKVWHPDRFAQDASLRQKAEEKLKEINEAWSTILESREGGAIGGAEEDAGAWRVRFRGGEMRFADIGRIADLVARGALSEEAEVFDPAAARWAPLASNPLLRESLLRARGRRNRAWAFTLAALAMLILLRRPSPGGLLVAVVLFGAAWVFLARR